jgi:hypothetical protein
MSRKKEAEILKRLDNLDSGEADLLAGAVEKRSQTIYWPKDAAEVKSLIAKGFLESVPDDSTLLYKPFSIPRFVWDHILQPDVFQALKTKAS